MGIWIIILTVGGLVFMYFNIKVFCKFNIAASFLTISIYLIFFRKKHFLKMKVIYSEFINKLLHRYNRTKSVDKVKAHFDYLYYVRKYGRKMMKFFIVKNIHLYPECGVDSTFAVEFTVVNNVLKKSLLNG